MPRCLHWLCGVNLSQPGYEEVKNDLDVYFLIVEYYVQNFKGTHMFNHSMFFLSEAEHNPLLEQSTVDAQTELFDRLTVIMKSVGIMTYID